MSDTILKRPKFTWKDALTVVLFVVTVFSFSVAMVAQSKSNKEHNRIQNAEMVLLKDQLRRNTILLESYNLPLIDYRLNEMDGKLDAILAKLGVLK